MFFQSWTLQDCSNGCVYFQSQSFRREKSTTTKTDVTCKRSRLSTAILFENLKHFQLLGFQKYNPDVRTQQLDGFFFLRVPVCNLFLFEQNV